MAIMLAISAHDTERLKARCASAAGGAKKGACGPAAPELTRVWHRRALARSGARTRAGLLPLCLRLAAAGLAGLRRFRSLTNGVAINRGCSRRAVLC
jgi:hypothetical protein